MSAGALLDYAEAAALLGVSRSILRRWVAEQRVPHVRLAARTVRFDGAELRSWLETRRVPVYQSATAGGR